MVVKRPKLSLAEQFYLPAIAAGLAITLKQCVEVNGHMLADVSGDEVEAYLLKAGVVQPTAASAD